MVLVAAALLAGVLVFTYNPVGSRFYPPCLFHVLTGWYCPGCGSLRAVHQLAHGNLIRALDFNPLMILMLPVLAWLSLPRLASTLTGRAYRDVYVPVWAIWTLFAVIVLYGVARNLPMQPFMWLAP